MKRSPALSLSLPPEVTMSSSEEEDDEEEEESPRPRGKGWTIPDSAGNGSQESESEEEEVKRVPKPRPPPPRSRSSSPDMEPRLRALEQKLKEINILIDKKYNEYKKSLSSKGDKIDFVLLPPDRPDCEPYERIHLVLPNNQITERGISYMDLSKYYLKQDIQLVHMYNLVVKHEHKFKIHDNNLENYHTLSCLMERSFDLISPRQKHLCIQAYFDSHIDKRMTKEELDLLAYLMEGKYKKDYRRKNVSFQGILAEKFPAISYGIGSQFTSDMIESIKKHKQFNKESSAQEWIENHARWQNKPPFNEFELLEMIVDRAKQIGLNPDEQIIRYPKRRMDWGS